jgi:hypothetical protein
MAGGDVAVTHTALALKQAVDLPGGSAPGAGGASTSAVTRVATNVANVTLKALNAARIGLCIQNNSTTNLFLKLGATAAIGAGVESFTVRMVPNAYYEVPYGYTGIVDGIWDGADATGEALVTELTA